MPLTALDSHTALIVIDLQKDIVNVALALDAMTDIREEAHGYCIRNVSLV